MSIPSLGLIGSLTSGQLQQTRGADADRATQDARNQSREAASARQAEAAAGVGEMLQDEATSDRDADGRRPWELPEPSTKAPDDAESAPPEGPHSRDPSGHAGHNLDLTG